MRKNNWHSWKFHAALPEYVPPNWCVARNEKSRTCDVSALSLLASNRTVFLCKLPQTLFFTALGVQVLHDGRMLYNRSLNVENVCKWIWTSVRSSAFVTLPDDAFPLLVFLDPPRNLTVVSSGKEGQLNVSWLPPLLKYMDDSMIYEVRYAVEGSHAGKVRAFYFISSRDTC